MSNTVLLGSLPKYFYETLSLNDYEKHLNHLEPFPNNLIYPLPTALWSSTPGWNCLRNKTQNPHWLLWEGSREEPVIVYCSVPGAVVPEGKLVRLQHLITHLRFETASGGKPCTTIRTSWWSGSLASLSSEFSWAESSDIASSSGRTGHWTTKWWVHFLFQMMMRNCFIIFVNLEENHVPGLQHLPPVFSLVAFHGNRMGAVADDQVFNLRWYDS